MTDPLRYMPRDIRADERELWVTVFGDALGYTKHVPDFYMEDVALTATMATRTARDLPNYPARVETPREDYVLELGIFRRLDYVGDDGRIKSLAYSNTKLLWAPKQKTLLAMPGASIGQCDLPPPGTSDRLAKTWTDGRKGARCAAEIDLPQATFRGAYPAVAISYFSTKFGGAQEYIHHFDTRGVAAWIAPRKGLIVRGGKLRIETHGITG